MLFILIIGQTLVKHYMINHKGALKFRRTLLNFANHACNVITRSHFTAISFTSKIEQVAIATDS